MSLRTFIVAFCALAMMVACNNGDFAGGGGKKAANPKPQAPAPAPSPKPPKPNKPDKPTDDGGDEGEDDTPASDDNSGDEGTDLGNLIDDGKPDTKPDNTLVDLLSGLLNTTNDVVPSQPDDNTVIFGGNKAFHIGDGQQANSSCIGQLTIIGVSGKKFVFEFEVLEDKQGTVDVDIGVCGVDYSTNTAYITKDGQPIGNTPIPKNATDVKINGQVSTKGRYAVVVESRAAGQENPQVPTDHDDFIATQVKVRVNGVKIKPGKVGTSD